MADTLTVTHSVQDDVEALCLALQNSCINPGSEKCESLTTAVIQTKIEEQICMQKCTIVCTAAFCKY